jgi:hypothetical protein
MASTTNGPKLTPDVRFLGVAFSDDDSDEGRRAATFLANTDPDQAGSWAAVATYVAFDRWQIEMSSLWPWDFDGVHEVRISPGAITDWDDFAGGVPSSIPRLIPLRHAQWALSAAIAQQTIGQRVRPFLRTAYGDEGDWARLAHVYVVLKEAGIKHKASTLNKIEPSGSVSVWTSRLQKLRDPSRWGYLEPDGKEDWRMTDKAQVAFSRTLNTQGTIDGGHG